MQPFDRNRHGPKIGALHPLFGEGSWVPIEQVLWAEAYLHIKWHLDMHAAVWPQ